MAEHRELFEQINRYIQLTLEGGLLLQWTSEAQMQQKTQTLVAVETVQMTFDRIFFAIIPLRDIECDGHFWIWLRIGCERKV